MSLNITILSGIISGEIKITTFYYLCAFQFDLDSMWTYIYGVPADQRVPTNNAKCELNAEAACVVLAMIRAMLNQVSYILSESIMNDIVVSSLSSIYILILLRELFM